MHEYFGVVDDQVRVSDELVYDEIGDIRGTKEVTGEKAFGGKDFKAGETER